MEFKSSLKLVQLIGENSWNESDADYKAMRSVEGLKNIASYASGVGPSISHVLKKRLRKIEVLPLVRTAHELGLVVHPYTLRNDALPKYAENFNDMMDLLFQEANVDGIFTDFPDLAIEYLKQ